jgi:hypothetical protein
MSDIKTWIARLSAKLLMLRLTAKYTPWPKVIPHDWPLYRALSDAVPFNLVQRVTDLALYHYDCKRANVWLEHAKIAKDSGYLHQSNSFCMAYMAMHPDYNRGEMSEAWKAWRDE